MTTTRVGLRQLLELDYVRALRRYLSYAQVLEAVLAFESIFPAFNERSVRMMSAATFMSIAQDLGLNVRAAPFDGAEGLALHGFYANAQNGVLKRPLIFVNTAHHPLVATTTFVHELAHHVTADLMPFPQQKRHQLFETDYEAQLTDPHELLADVIVSFAGYPERAARKIFSSSWNWGLVARAENLDEGVFAEVRHHLRRAYRFDLAIARVPEDQIPHYLSGMVHYAKLRWALLAEYDL